MQKFLFLLIFLSFNYNGACQPDYASTLKHFSIKNKDFGTINFYVSKRGIEQRKPLLLVLDGSGGRPLFRFEMDTAHKSTLSYPLIFTQYNSLSSKYHIVFISKPGVKLVDSFIVNSLDSNIESALAMEYNQRLSAEWRAGTAASVIDFLVQNLKINPKKIVVMGTSEGAQVAPRVAVMNKKVTHVVCFSGNGLNQFYDFIIGERMKAASGEITESDAQHNIDTLMNIFKDIYTHPLAVDKFWNGHTYQRWASFCQHDPLDYMFQLNIPIYLAHGTADDNTAVLSADYIALEFLRRGKKNLTYKTYPGYNHYFQQVYKDKPPAEHIDEVMNEMLTWLDKQ
jgi:dienelactone hydrolase